MVLSKEVRKALKFACSRKPSPDPALTTKSTLTSVREPGAKEVEGSRAGWKRQEPQGTCSLCFVPHFFSSLHPLLGGGRAGEMVCVAWEERDLGVGRRILTQERWEWN